jgi:hypothetical protein
MDFLKLSTSTYMPTDLIEGWDSLIWTERYREFGEFELHSYDVANTVALLPMYTLVSLVDSYEVMMVESVDITVDNDGKKMVVVKGRSCVSILDHRMIMGYDRVTKFGTGDASGSNIRTPINDNDDTYVLTQIYNAICPRNNNGFDNNFDVNTMTSPDHDRGDEISNTAVSNTTHGTGLLPRMHYIKPQTVWEHIHNILPRNDRGIRTLRPITGSIKLLTFDIVSTTDFNRVYTTTSNVTTLLFDIYNGYDRTLGQSTNTPVIITAAQGHLLNPEYLFSLENYKNTGMLTSNAAAYGYVYPLKDDSSSITGKAFDSSKYRGWKRRVSLMDGGSNYDDYAIDVDSILSIFDDVGDIVRPLTKTLFFDGQISTVIPYKYGPNKDYYLGDWVTLLGEYGVNQDLQVSEYIRTQDSSGETGYPTLTDPTAS